MKNLTYSLLKLPQTVFTAREIALVLKETNTDIVKSKINYYVKRGEIIALRRGIYAKDENYNEFELATKLYTPSYISFETILAKYNIVFQYDSKVHLASYLTREVKVNKTKLSYKKVKDKILHSPFGIENDDNYPRASLERAFLDSIYIFGKMHFDNTEPIDFEKCENLLPIYGGKIIKNDLKPYVNNK